MKADDIKTGELSATSTSTYILKGRCVRERGAGGGYPVRPGGNPQPQGVLLSIYLNAY